MKALINPNEPSKYIKSWETQNLKRIPIYENIGALICEISNKEFEIAYPLFWVDCDSSININYYYDLDSKSFKELPPDAEYVQPIPVDQPNTTGTQSI
jgi:hypothetical protein